MAEAAYAFTDLLRFTGSSIGVFLVAELVALITARFQPCDIEAQTVTWLSA